MIQSLRRLYGTAWLIAEISHKLVSLVTCKHSVTEWISCGNLHPILRPIDKLEVGCCICLYANYRSYLVVISAGYVETTASRWLCSEKQWGIYRLGWYNSLTGLTRSTGSVYEVGNKLRIVRRHGVLKTIDIGYLVAIFISPVHEGEV